MAYFHKYCEVMKAKLPLTKRTDVIVLTSAILFLAGKSSENIRGTRGVLNVVRHLHGLSPESLELRQVRSHSIQLELTVYFWSTSFSIQMAKY